MKRNGQAAMEFLMTYGWAILAAVIAIGVLAYFGVFSPGKYITGNAIVNPPFYLNAHNAKASSGITLELKNNGGEEYLISSVHIAGCGTYAVPTMVSTEDLTAITVPCVPALVEGDSIRSIITITYRKVGGTVDLVSTGTIADKIGA